ncbi:MAG: Gfo/Idh/MocA family oxidoreductase [Brachybacterium sp.]|nr:Gfo/Idh/MocA family oxidoreductase [Brachybacterium sp.]
MRTRYAIIGTGHRAQMYLDAISGEHADVAELVAMFDLNPGRMDWYRSQYPAFSEVEAHPPDALEEVCGRLGVTRLIVTSIDRTHREHVVRALEAGMDVVVEKPLTIDAESARAVAEAAERTGREIVVTFNYRYSPRNSTLREVIASGRIGTPLSMVFEWVLDTSHGADYFRRWHRDKANSGGLFVHKASHHFDLASWWLDATPRSVVARGGTKFYGADAARERGQEVRAERGTHDGEHDPFELDLRRDDRLQHLYLEQEHHDGYRRDQSVFAPGVTTEDTLTALVDFEGGSILTYVLNAHSPWEGYRVAVNGTKGRAELEVVERAEVDPSADGPAKVDPSVLDATAGVRGRGERLIVQRHFAPAEEVEIVQGSGAHGGGDALMLAEVFRGPQQDPLSRAADWHDGLRAISIGVAGNESLATGNPVDIRAHLGLDVSSGAR